MSQQDNKEMAKYFYRASAADFKKIPGGAIAYWASRQVFDSFCCMSPISNYIITREGLTTGNNDIFVRNWWEVEVCNTHVLGTPTEFTKRWYPMQKGGEFRRWFGNLVDVVDWENDGLRMRSYKDLDTGRVRSHNYNGEFAFKEGFSWTYISSGSFAVRYVGGECLFNSKGPMGFNNSSEFTNEYAVATLNSKVSAHILKMLAPTLDFKLGQVLSIPVAKCNDTININSQSLICISKNDWNSKEISMGFKSDFLTNNISNATTIQCQYNKLRSYWFNATQEMQRLEEENNRVFIEAYGLQDELTPEVPLSEITLTCNPHYRYGSNLTDEEREARLQSDTIAELVSYAIGCMMGRYSLDREGLVYAHAGNVGFNDLVAEGAYQRFAADGDGILPLTSEHWFEDDIAARIEEFVRTVWGADTLEENLQFIADSLCLSAIKPPKKGGETSRETIRRYLSTQFFKDHLKTYKKRPIYWLFSSGKEKAFECLVYLHRYNEATLPRMRTEYVTPLLGQMASRIERLRLQKADASTAEAKRLDKQIDGLTKQLAELRAFDDQLKHHADMKITLDLDDGVKVNYGKFGTLLSDVKAITGDKGE